MKSSIIVLGSINTDLVVKSARLPAPGETVLGEEFFEAAGGKGANQAVAAARLAREPVTFLGAVGDDTFGRRSLAGFSNENLNCDFIKVMAGEPSGVALIMVDANGENCISVAPGANQSLTEGDVDQVPNELFVQASVFLACLESPLATVARGLQRAKASGLTTILNPAPANSELVGHPILQLVDVITPNATEATMLARVALDSKNTAREAGQSLRTQGPNAVIITLGSAGALIVSEQIESIEAIEVTPCDATAAGDAFNGALAVAISEGMPLEQAARFATVAAGISVTRLGAQPSLPAREEVESRLG
jgi:ribokinase